MNNIIYYPIIVEEVNDEDGHYFVATSPNIKGMVTDGDTFEEVSNNAIDAIETVIDGEQHIPEPVEPGKLNIKANEKIVYVPVSPYKWIMED